MNYSISESNQAKCHLVFAPLLGLTFSSVVRVSDQQSAGRITICFSVCKRQSLFLLFYTCNKSLLTL